MSDEPETKKFPLGEKATDETHLRCPTSAARSWPPIQSASQMRTVLSFDPETIRHPSVENATSRTMSSCPWRAGTSSVPEAVLQTRIVWSLEAEPMRVPSEENTIDKI